MPFNLNEQKEAADRVGIGPVLKGWKRMLDLDKSSDLDSGKIHSPYKIFTNRVAGCCLGAFVSAAVMTPSISWAQAAEGEGAAQGGEVVEEPKDPRIAKEAGFVDYLIERRLFSFAEPALESFIAEFPTEAGRKPVFDARILLAKGEADKVEAMLKAKDPATDTRMQAVMLLLGMYYDNQGDIERATNIYKQFLLLNKDGDVTDPDVIRYFAPVGQRLGILLQDQGEYWQASNVFNLVSQGMQDRGQKRRFLVMSTLAAVEHAIKLPAGDATRPKVLEMADGRISELAWVSDNYGVMAQAVNAFIPYADGKLDEAMKGIATVDTAARRVEGILLNEIDKLSEDDPDYEAKKAGIMAESPQALIRYLRGRMYFDQAKQVLVSDRDKAEDLSKKAAKELFNCFLKYGGNPFSRRAGLTFKDLNAWTVENLDLDLRSRITASDAIKVKIAKRELDLVGEQVRMRDMAGAEASLREIIANTDPESDMMPLALQYMLLALNGQSKNWEVMAVVTELLERYPDYGPTQNLAWFVYSKAVERATAPDEDAAAEDGADATAEKPASSMADMELLMDEFLKYMPENGRMPAVLMALGILNSEAGEMAKADKYFTELLDRYAGTREATQIARMRAGQAMQARNYAEAAKAYRTIYEHAIPGLEKAKNGIGLVSAIYFEGRDALASLDELEGDVEAQDAARRTAEAAFDKTLEMVDQLEAQLKPGGDNPYYNNVTDPKELGEIVEKAIYLRGQAYLRKGELKDDAVAAREGRQILQQYLKDYPSGVRAPDTLLNLAMIHSQRKETEEAQRFLDILTKDHKDSPIAKNARFSLVRTSSENGDKPTAESAVSGMINDAGSYSMVQFYLVGNLMLEHESWELAYQCFDIVLKMVENEADEERKKQFNQLALVRRGTAAMNSGRVDEGIADLNKMIETYPRSAKVESASLALAKAYTKKDDFKSAEAALGRVRKIRDAVQEEPRKTEIGIRFRKALAELYVAQELNGKALNQYLTIADVNPAEAPGASADLERALIDGMLVAKAMAAETPRNWNNVEFFARRHLDGFALSKEARTVQGLLYEAITNKP